MSAGRTTAATAIALLTLVLAAVGCSSGEAPPATTVPPRPEGGGTRQATTVPSTPPGSFGDPGTATIARFDVPASVRCAPGATGDLGAVYETDAIRVVFTVDNVPATGQPPATGTFTIPLPCDGSVHTVVLSAYDATGKATVQSRAVLSDDGTG